MDSGQHADVQRPGALRTFFSFLGLVAFALVFSWVLRTFVIQAYGVPSGSMEDTIMTGDMVFSEKVSYLFRDPEPGDIVTFQDPVVPGRILIKRCVAVGGQTVDINDEDGLVYVDGQPLDEPYAKGASTYRLANSIAEVAYPYTVPEGELWVMGDNRMNSQDSRYFGSVPAESVTGRGVLVYWPLSSFGLLE